MEKRWSEDYVQHLRTSYFALVLVCVVGLAISLSRGEAQISAAHQELDYIWELASGWDSHFLQKPADPAHATDLDYPSDPLTFTLGSNAFAVKFSVPSSTSFVTLNTPNRPKQAWRTDCLNKGLTVFRPPNDTLGDLLTAPSNVQDFQEIWDALFYGATLHEPLTVGPLFTRAPLTNDFQILHTSDAFQDQKIRELNLRIRCLVPSSLSVMQKLDGSLKMPYQLQTQLVTPGFHFLYFPITGMRDSYVDAQGLLFVGKDRQWHHGLFKDSFRELSAVVGDNKPVDWAHAMQLVANDEANWHPNENFQALGLKFPVSRSVGWCAITILVLQLYLWVLLFEYKKKLGEDDPAWNIAWIGMYQSAPARVSSAASGIILPVAASAALRIRGLYLHSWHLSAWLWLSAEVCTAAVLASLTYSALPRPDAGLALSRPKQ